MVYIAFTLRQHSENAMVLNVLMIYRKYNTVNGSIHNNNNREKHHHYIMCLQYEKPLSNLIANMADRL